MGKANGPIIGFTLIELLVVIAIIAFFSVVELPALARKRRQHTLPSQPFHSQRSLTPKQGVFREKSPSTDTGFASVEPSLVQLMTVSLLDQENGH